MSGQPDAALVGKYLHILCEDSRWYWAMAVAHSVALGMVHVWFEDGTRTWYTLASLREDGGGGALGAADAAGSVHFDFVSAAAWSARLEAELVAERERVAAICAKLEARRLERKAAANAVKPAGDAAAALASARQGKHLWCEGGGAPKKKFAVLEGALAPELVERTFRSFAEGFVPQTISTSVYPKWVISRYMEVSAREQHVKGGQQGGATPDLELLEKCRPLLDACDKIFRECFVALHGPRVRRQQQPPRVMAAAAPAAPAAADGGENDGSSSSAAAAAAAAAAAEASDDGYDVRRLQSFVTRYRPLPGENTLAKHVDGITIDGTVVVGMPTDTPFDGGGLTIWEGHPDEPLATHNFPMRPGDVCFLDKLVWHQANPITTGERWAIVIFYRAK